jgi:hypothetical protein
MALTPLMVIDWVTDSGTSNHTTSDVGNLTSVRPPTSTDPSSIIVGNRLALPVTSVGDLALPLLFYLNNILVTPDIIQNLLFVHSFTTNNWYSMEFDFFDLCVKDLSTQNVITVTPHVMKILIKFLKLQLSSNARLNQDTKVWNQMRRQRIKI